MFHVNVYSITKELHCSYYDVIFRIDLNIIFFMLISQKQKLLKIIEISTFFSSFLLVHPAGVEPVAFRVGV